MKTALPLLVLAAGLQGCGGDSNNDPVKKSFADFQAEVAASVSSEARDCGSVDIGESDVDTNTCAAEAFNNDETFYATYRLQGIDSSVGRGWTMNASGEVYFWYYDSNPCGCARGSDSVIEPSLCVNATFSGSVDSGQDEVFLCE